MLLAAHHDVEAHRRRVGHHPDGRWRLKRPLLGTIHVERHVRAPAMVLQKVTDEQGMLRRHLYTAGTLMHCSVMGPEPTDMGRGLGITSIGLDLSRRLGVYRCVMMER